MGKKGLGKFVVGAGLGVSLGVLFAPKKGKELRKDLGEKCKELVDYVKSLDKDEVKDNILEKIDDIKDEIKDLDKEKVLSNAKKKGKDILNKCDELVDLAVKKGTPYLEKATDEVRSKAIDVLEDTISRLEKNKKKTK